MGPGTGAIAVAKSPSRHQALLTRWFGTAIVLGASLFEAANE